PTLAERLTPKHSMELSLDWPVRLGQDCKLKLVLSGGIIRREAGRLVLKGIRYQFRTAGSAGREGLLAPRIQQGRHVTSLAASPWCWFSTVHKVVSGSPDETSIQ